MSEEKENDYWEEFKTYAVEAAIEMAFKAINTSGSGTLSAGELVNVVQMINSFHDTKINPTEDQMKILMLAADTNLDGGLSLDEVKKLLLGGK